MQYQGHKWRTDFSKYPIPHLQGNIGYVDYERKYDNNIGYRKPWQPLNKLNDARDVQDIPLPEPPPDYDTAISESGLSSTYKSVHTNHSYVEIMGDSGSTPILPDQPTRSVLHSLKVRIILVVVFVCVILAGAGVTLYATRVFEGKGNSSAVKDDPPTEPGDIFECQKGFDVPIRGHAIYRCLVQNVTKETLKLVRLSKENQTIVEITGIHEKTHDNVALSSREGSSKGILVTVKLSQAKCNNSGDYYLAIHSEEAEVYLDFSVRIEDSVRSVDIAKDKSSRGYIPGETLSLTCSAEMGCSSQPIRLVKVVDGDTISVPPDTLVDSSTIPHQYGFNKTESYGIILQDGSDGDKYRCEIQFSNHTNSSTEYEVAIVDKNFCQGQEINGRYRHPRRCDAWITCQTEDHPVIQTCPNGYHYRLENDWCDHPGTAGCQ